MCQMNTGIMWWQSIVGIMNPSYHNISSKFNDKQSLSVQSKYQGFYLQDISFQDNQSAYSIDSAKINIMLFNIKIDSSD